MGDLATDWLNMYLRASLAFIIALCVHASLVVALMISPTREITPPKVMGGFEVVDLSAFGVAAISEPEQLPKPVEESEAKIEPEPEAEREPEVAEPIPLPKPKTKPVIKPKPKPVAVTKPKPESKPEAKSAPKPTSKPQMADVGSQQAFVPPSSTAAYLQNPKPSYPALAQRRGMQGVVLLLVDVSVDGTPLSVKLKNGSGYSILDKAAIRAVQKWRFAPATRDGKAVKASIEVPIRFILNDA